MTKVTVIDRTMAELSFGKRIKARREQLGTSGYRVSADAGVDSGLYAKIEVGAPPLLNLEGLDLDVGERVGRAIASRAALTEAEAADLVRVFEKTKTGAFAEG